MKSFTLYLLTASVLSVFFSCSNEKITDTTALQGKWSVIQGEKNNMAVDYLAGFFIEFKEPDSVSTNFNGEGTIENGNYTLGNSKIFQKTAKGEMIYTIDDFQDSTITLITNMDGSDFKITLKKERVTESEN